MSACDVAIVGAGPYGLSAAAHLKAADGLDVFACASENKKSVVIFAVNSKTEPVQCSLGFPGFDRAVRIASAEALCDTLDARQPDVMNHWNAMERVKTIPLSPTQNKLVIPALSAAAIECEVF